MCYRIGTFGLKGILSNQSDYLQNLRVAVLRISKNLQNLRPEGEGPKLAGQCQCCTGDCSAEIRKKKRVYSDDDDDADDNEDDSRNFLEQTKYVLFLKSGLGEAMP